MAVTTDTVELTTGTTVTSPTIAVELANALTEAQSDLPVWLQKVVSVKILGISVWQLTVTFLLILAALILRRIVMTVLIRLSGGPKEEPTRFGQMMVRAAVNPAGMAVAIFGILAAVQVFTLPEGVALFASNLCVSILYVTAAWLLFNFADTVGHYLDRVAANTESRLDEQLVPIFRKAVKVFIVVIAVLQVIDQMGGDVKGLLAGLGLGGLAFALAARDSLANIFGSIVILADQPFAIGDWIEADGVEGTVEEVGFRSTRIRTFAKSLITVPNSKVADWAINNWSAMPKRRVKMIVGVSYETTPKQMQALLEAIRKLLREDERVHQEFFLVNFTDFGDSALEIYLYYFTVTINWAEYLHVREEINLAIMRLIKSLGLEIAFPTRTVYLRQDSAPETPPQFLEDTNQLPE